MYLNDDNDSFFFRSRCHLAHTLERYENSLQKAQQGFLQFNDLANERFCVFLLFLFYFIQKHYIKY